MATPDLSSQPGWDTFVKQHGGVVGKPYATDPTVSKTEPVLAAGVDTGQTHTVSEPNPNPTYHYELADGTTVDMTSDGQVKSVSAAAAKPASSDPSKWQTINDPRTGQPIAIQDPATGDKVALPTLGAGAAPQLVQAGGYFFSWDGSKLTTVGAVPDAPAAPTKPQIVSNAGSLYSWDGDKLTLLQGPSTSAAPTTYAAPNGTLYQWNGTSQTWTPAPGVSGGRPPTVVSTDTSGAYIVTVDDQGNVSTTPNANYVPPSGTALTASGAQPYIPILKPGGTGIDWQPNKNFVSGSDALASLYPQVRASLATGDISLQDAISLMNAANARLGQDVQQRQQDITEQDSQRSANATLIDSRARWGSQYAQQALQTIAAANQYAPPGADAAGAYLGALEMGQRFLAGLGGLNDPNSPVGGQTPGFMQAPLNGTPFQVPPRVGGTVGPAAGSSPAEVAAAAAHAATSAALQPSTPSANSGAPTPPDQTSSGPLLPPGVAGTAQDPRYAGAVPPSSLAPAAPLFSSLGFKPPQTPASPAGPGTSNGMPLHADGSPLATPADVARVFGRSSIGAQQ